MAHASASRASTTGAARIFTAASTLSSENQSLIVEIRKSITLMKAVAVDLEKDRKSEKVKELEDAVLELLVTYDDCTRFSEAIVSVGRNYLPSHQLTNFKKAMEEEVSKLKVESPFVPQSSPLYRQFKEAIWNVHHAGQPMPGEEQEDLVMTSTQGNLLNITCPLTGKPIFELQNPVRCMDCKHVYEKDPIMHYIRTQKPQPKCPAAGCPKLLQIGRVVCDPLLRIEIDEMQSVGSKVADSTLVEDFTEIDDD